MAQRRQQRHGDFRAALPACAPAGQNLANRQANGQRSALAVLACVAADTAPWRTMSPLNLIWLC